MQAARICLLPSGKNFSGGARMLQITHQTNMLVAVEPIDFRKRIDGTAAVCRAHFARDPLDGVVYIFRNRARTMIRIYFFDGLVEWSCDLRIASGTFPYWPQSSLALTGLSAHQFYLLIKGGDPRNLKVREDYKKLA